MNSTFCDNPKSHKRFECRSNAATPRSISRLSTSSSSSARAIHFVQKYASAAWTAHHGRRIRLPDVEAIIPAVRASIDKTFYREVLENLSPRERMVVIALAELGSGSHELRTLAAVLGVGSMALGSIRTRLIQKGVVFAPRSGHIQFRIPLAERYIVENRAAFETPEVVEYRRKFNRIDPKLPNDGDRNSSRK
jgi:hypothetical protein